MLTITICDDIELNKDIIYEFTTDYIRKHHQNSLIKSYTDPIEVFHDTQPSNIYILDMLMPGLSGRELALRLHEKHPYAKFIFISVDAQSAIGTHDYAVDYLVKPVSAAQLGRALTKAINQLKEEIFVVRTPDGDRQIRYHDVLYASCINRALEYYLENGEVVRTVCVRGKAIDAYGEVAIHDGFMFLAPSMVINLAQVELVNREFVEFADKRKVFYTQKYYKELRRKWGEVIGEFPRTDV